MDTEGSDNRTNRSIHQSEQKISLRADITSNIKTISLSGDQIVVTDELPGVYCEGIQYYDLKGIGFINYAGMANLIDFLKTLLAMGVDVRFVNVNDQIKDKIRSICLEHIITCI